MLPVIMEIGLVAFLVRYEIAILPPSKDYVNQVSFVILAPS
ncbi:hypothetical protein T4A_9844 [Trichinella pseudospiralis]|uniref:Uncharacterized protein n=1 Tax=Trichinella pseudospiralis TaxID=6337 RepID=A0A0V1EMX2_TRIPS|nr:hypothetical protein T4A_9844 [Trichinella pseudospiralis]